MSLIHGVWQSTGWLECSISEWQVSETVLEKPDNYAVLKERFLQNGYLKASLSHSQYAPHMCLFWNGNPWKVKTSPSSKHFEFIMNLLISRMFSEWGNCSLVSKNVLPWSGVAKPPDIKLLETNLSSNLPLNTSHLTFQKIYIVWHGIPSLMWGPVTGWCQSPVGISSSSWPGGRFDDTSLLTFPVRVAFFPRTGVQDLLLFHVFDKQKWQII